MVDCGYTAGSVVAIHERHLGIEVGNASPGSLAESKKNRSPYVVLLCLTFVDVVSELFYLAYGGCLETLSVALQRCVE